MSNENDRSQNTWGGEYDDDTSGTFRDAYLNAANPQRPRPRSNNTPQNDMPETPERSDSRRRPRGVPGSGRIYEENDELPSRPRPTRQSREQVYARLRQRPRQPIYSRDQEDTSARAPAQAKKQGQPTPRREQIDDYPYQQPASRQRPARPSAGRGAASTGPVRPNQREREQYDEYEYDEYDEYEVVPGERRQPARQQPRKRGRGRRVFSTLFVGCLGGLLTLIVVAAVALFLILHNTPLGTSFGVGKSPYTQASQQVLTLGNATQLIIKSQVGNISINVDQNASSASVASVKRVQASSQSDANGQFRGITLSTKQIAQGADPSCTASSCLLITTAVPTTGGSGGLFGGGNGSSIDLTITLPASFSNPVSPDTLAVNTNAGDIAVNGFNGILNLNSTAGNISIAHNSVIFAGTCIQTTHGNITVAQGSFFDLDQPSNLVPCSATTSAGAHPWFNIQSGVGNVDIALLSSSANMLLDANTNRGKISNDFGLNIPTDSDGSASYHGSLLPNTHPTASLYIAVSTGNIAIHKQ